MFDTKSLLDQLLGTSLPGGTTVGGAVDKAKGYARENPLATGAAAGGLAALLLGTKTGRSVAGNAAALGGLALLGGLAYKAYRNWQGGDPTAGPAAAGGDVPPAPEGFTPTSEAESQHLGLALVTAMIAAAKADGHIDADEQARIFDKMDELQLDSEAKAFVMDELRAPLDIDKIAALATNEQVGMQIYAASRLAIEPDHPAEKAYLETLADKLRLMPGFVAQVDQAVREAQVH